MTTPATWSTYTLWSVVNEIMDKNLRLFPILFKQFKHLQYAFFDVKQLAWQGALSLKPKEIPWIEPTVTVDGVSIKWLDYGLFDFSTTITTGATLSVSGTTATLVVWSTAWFAVNDTVYIPSTTTGDEFDWIVKTINSTTSMDITVTRVNTTSVIPATLTVTTGQKVERGFWRRNDNDEILRPASTFDYVEFQSYIQHFSRRIEFTKAELNKVYKYEMEAKEEARKKFEYNIAIIVQEVNKAIYKGRNIAPWSGATDKMEMLGLETACMSTGAIDDISASTKPVKDLFAAIEKSFLSWGIIGEEPMMLLCNDKFLSELANSNADKVRYEKYVDELRFEVQTVQTYLGAVDLVRDPMLNKLYSYSVAFVVPRSMVKIWVRENQSYDPKGWVTKADQSIRLYPVIHNLREKELYDMAFECGMIIGGLSAEHSPVRMIKWFTS